MRATVNDAEARSRYESAVRSIEVRHELGDLDAPRAYLCAGLALQLADWSSEPAGVHADVRSDPGGGSRLFEGEIESAKHEKFLWTCDVKVVEDQLSAEITEIRRG